MSDVWSSNDDITWEQAISTANWATRHAASAIYYNSKHWIMGGFSTGTTPIADVWNSTDGITWTLVTDSPAWAARG